MLELSNIIQRVFYCPRQRAKAQNRTRPSISCGRYHDLHASHTNDDRRASSQVERTDALKHSWQTSSVRRSLLSWHQFESRRNAA